MGRYIDIANRVEVQRGGDRVNSTLPEDQAQVEFLIVEVTRCQHCNHIAWRLNSAGGLTCGVCHPEEGEEV